MSEDKPVCTILSNEAAQMMRHLAITALQDAHASKITPEAFFGIVVTSMKLLSAVDASVSLQTALKMLQVDTLSKENMTVGLAAAVTVSSTDALKFYQELDRTLDLVHITLTERTLN